MRMIMFAAAAVVVGRVALNAPLGGSQFIATAARGDAAAVSSKPPYHADATNRVPPGRRVGGNAPYHADATNRDPPGRRVGGNAPYQDSARPLADAGIDGFDAAGMPFARVGFGVRRNFYQSGRITAKISDAAGLFELDYVGRQPFRSQRFYNSPAENCAWSRGFEPQVLIDGVPYRLAFSNTVHYPFGYASECALDGVRLRHEFVLDRNAAFRRITVLDNPGGKEVRCRVVQMNAGMGQGAKWRVAGDRLVAEANFDGGASVAMEIGAANPVRFPLNGCANPLAFRRSADATQDLRFDVEETRGGDEHLFWWVFDKADGEDLSGARIDRVFADFASRRAADARFETGDAFADGWLGCVAPMSASHEVDGIGAFRASQTYWVWGWDAMVHAGALAVCGRAAEVKRMLSFFREIADPDEGILHAYGTTFKFSGGGSDAPGGAVTLPKAVQLFWVVLLNDYANATGDESFKSECLPFARLLVERAKASVPAGEVLPRGIGWFPDNPYAAGQGKDDCAVINCAIYWQGLMAWNELTGEDAELCDRVADAIRERFWDAEAGWWSDSWDTARGVRRGVHPLYGVFHVSSFARRFDAGGDGDAARTADAARRGFMLGGRLAMFGPRSSAWMADGNQLGSYYPVADRTFWNAQNAAGRTDALALFRRIVGDHARVLTYPEGQTVDAANADPATASDELACKQFFSEKCWLADALDLWLGLGVEKGGLRFHPMNDGTPFAVRGLSVRGATLDVEMTGEGANAELSLNGERIDGGFVPWGKLREGRNLVRIKIREGEVRSKK